MAARVVPVAEASSSRIRFRIALGGNQRILTRRFEFLNPNGTLVLEGPSFRLSRITDDELARDDVGLRAEAWNGDFGEGCDDEARTGDFAVRAGS